MESNKLAKLICDVLVEKKAQDIVKIDVEQKTTLADYFIIASGRSTTQIRALADYVEEATEKNGVFKLSREGVSEGRWAVLDFGDVIVHLFNDETRLFFHLEKMWGTDENVERIESEEKIVEIY